MDSDEERTLLWYAATHPASEFDEQMVAGYPSEQSRILREWSYRLGHGSQGFSSRYTAPAFFIPADVRSRQTPNPGMGKASEFEPNYAQIWMVLCELLFALRRPHGSTDVEGIGHGLVSHYWWNRYKEMEDAYLYYDWDDVKYGWVLYLDIESAPGVTELESGQVGVLEGQAVFRQDITMIFKAEGPSGGGTEAQATLSIEVDESAVPLDVPILPKWSDGIKEKFHRSDDRDMANWDKSLDDWTTEFQIALNL